MIEYNNAVAGATFSASGDVSPMVNIRIGNENDGGFKGSLDDIRIYNRALTEAEVEALYEFEKPKTQQASTATPPAVVTPTPVKPRPTPTPAKPKPQPTPTFTSDPSNPQNVIVEAAIRKATGKPTGKLTKADLTKVTELTLSNTQITDADLKEVAKLEKLTYLRLNSCKQITGVGLKEFTKLKDLARLELSGTDLTDAGLKEVAKLKNLTYLDLRGCTQITATDLKELTKLEKLTNLILSGEQFTVARIAEFKTALPNCQISH